MHQARGKALQEGIRSGVRKDPLVARIPALVLSSVSWKPPLSFSAHHLHTKVTAAASWSWVSTEPDDVVSGPACDLMARAVSTVPLESWREMLAQNLPHLIWPSAPKGHYDHPLRGLANGGLAPALFYWHTAV